MVACSAPHGAGFFCLVTLKVGGMYSVTDVFFRGGPLRLAVGCVCVFHFFRTRKPHWIVIVIFSTLFDALRCVALVVLLA